LRHVDLDAESSGFTEHDVSIFDVLLEHQALLAVGTTHTGSTVARGRRRLAMRHPPLLRDESRGGACN
jgi:hypothetical protein